MLPKCCLPASKRSGRHHKPLDLTILCDLWTRGQYGVLWHMATKQLTPTPPTAHGSGKSGKHIDSAISFAQKGLYSKACQRLVSSGIAPNSPDTWKLLQSKHPSSPIPSPPLVQPNPITLPASINLLGVMATFPKYTSPGPAGMRFQHLIDVASVPLPTSICSTLYHVVNLLAAGKVPQEVSKYMAGASVIALTKEKPNCAPDIRSIAVGEVLRRLVGKCLCLLSCKKAANFFQYGVACPGGGGGGGGGGGN